MLDYIIQRVKMCERVDEIFVCTSHEAVDDIMDDVAWRNDVKVYRGSPDEVIQRMMAVGEQTNSDYLLRITGDNPFTSYEYIDRQVELALTHNLDYVRMVGAPIGATAEVMKFEALKHCFNSMDPSVSEYLMLFMFNPEVYKCGVLRPFEKDYALTSLTVDYPKDFARTKAILDKVKPENFLTLKLEEILRIIEQYNIPDSIVAAHEVLRLPYGKEMRYDDFIVDMNARAAKSINL